MPTPREEQDADLDDLLEAPSPSLPSSRQHHLEMAPLNLDYLTKGQLDVTPPSGRKTSNESHFFNPLHYTQAVCTYLAYAHPRLCSCMVMVMIVGTILVVSFSIMNPTYTVGEIKEDFSNIQSSFDLKLGQIDHWCLYGGDSSCLCEDPLLPTERGELQAWTNAHHSNKLLLKSDVDVAFLGESLVEEMNGRWMGQTEGAQLKAMRSMFQKKFSRESTGVEGVALGIAADTSPNVLWRLLHGEMPSTFNPKIWWVSLGMNDLGRMQCSEEVVVMGILRVVEEILTKKPMARVVINSILPMAQLRGGMYPLMTDYQDAFPERIHSSHYARKPANAKGPLNTDGERLLRPRERDIPAVVEKYMKKYENDPRNPVLDAARNKMKKYALFHQNKLPLWTSIHAINEELRRFCVKHDRVTFFDATDIFASRVEMGRYVLQSDMISIRGHPTVAGYEAWEDAILSTVNKILAEDEDSKSREKEESEDSEEEEEEAESSEEKPKSREEEEPGNSEEEKSESSDEESQSREEEEPGNSESEETESSEEESQSHEEEEPGNSEEEEEAKSSEEDAITAKVQTKKTEDHDGNSGRSHPEAKRKGKDSESGLDTESGEGSDSSDSKN